MCGVPVPFIVVMELLKIDYRQNNLKTCLLENEFRKLMATIRWNIKWMAERWDHESLGTHHCLVLAHCRREGLYILCIHTLFIYSVHRNTANVTCTRVCRHLVWHQTWGASHLIYCTMYVAWLFVCLWSR